MLRANIFSVSLLLTIAGNVIYHLAQKSIAAGAHPLVSGIVSYAVAIAVSVAALVAFPLRDAPLAEIARLNWATYVLGVAIAGVEAGFLLAYRSGWKISITAVTSNVSVTLVLMFLGVVFLGERLTAVRSAGVLLCIVGLLLMTRNT